MKLKSLIRGTVQGGKCKTVQYSVVQCNAVPCSAVQCSTVKCIAVLCSEVPCKFDPCKFTWPGTRPGQTHPGTLVFPPLSLCNQYEESNLRAFTVVPIEHFEKWCNPSSLSRQQGLGYGTLTLYHSRYFIIDLSSAVTSWTLRQNQCTIDTLQSQR